MPINSDFPDQLTNNSLDIGVNERLPQTWVPVRVNIPIADPIKIVGPIVIKGTPILAKRPKGVPPAQSGTAPQVTNVSISQEPTIVQAKTMSYITVSFSPSAIDKKFAGARVWFNGYQSGTVANPKWVLMEDGTTSPITFICEANHNVVQYKVQGFDSDGNYANFDQSPGGTIKLSGVVSAPPAPTIEQYLVGTPSGFQFSFYQVQLAAGVEDVIQSYKVYRNTSSTFSSATLKATIPHDATNGGLPVVYTDTINDSTGAEYWYWVTSVDTAGLESSPAEANQSNLGVVGSIGSTPVSLSTPLKSTSTTTSITWTTSPSCFFTRADGTKTVVGKTSTACTSLRSNVDYWFFPYWDEPTQSLLFVTAAQCNIPTITGVKFNGSTQWIQTAGVSMSITNVAVDGSNNLTITAANNLQAGQVVTFSGVGTATFLNGTTVTVASATGTSFTGSYSHAAYGPAADSGTASANTLNGAFSIELWFNSGVSAGPNALASFSAPQGTGSVTQGVVQVVQTTAGEIEFGVYSGAAWTNVTTAGAGTNDGAWHHIVCTWDGASTTSVWVDSANTSDGTHFWTGSLSAINTNAGYWHFAFCGGVTGAPATSNTYGTVTLSNIAFYPTCLGVAQVGAHFQAYVNLDEALYEAEVGYDVAYNFWELDETSGSTAADNFGTNTGTYEGSPSLNQTSAVVTVEGSPSIAFPFSTWIAIQMQSLRNRVPLSNGGITADTTSSGSKSGSGGGGSGGYSGGGGGGRGGCFSGNTLVKTRRGDIAIKDVVIGDYCWTAAGVWRPVIQIYVHQAEPRKLHDMGNNELVTFEHKILERGAWRHAGFIFQSTVEANEPIYHLSMLSSEPLEKMMDVDTERSFQLANGHFAHNMMIVKTY